MPALELLVDAVDDGVVLLILRCLGTASAVRLASTSAFLSRRLEDGHPSVLHRYVAELLSLRCPVPALETSGLAAAAPLRALRAAGSGCGHCEVLGFALLLAQQEEEGMARMFLEAMFRWELHSSREARRDLQAWRAVDLLLTSLLDVQRDVGRKLVQITAKAIRRAESELDAMIEGRAETLLSYCGQGYEATARQRSAAEFIRRRAGSSMGGPPGAMEALDAAIQSLDQTIWGYDEEGYTLACPQLVGFRYLRRMDLPYDHWWVRLDGPAIGRRVALCT